MMLFDFLLRLFPRQFRDAFGEEMKRVFADQRQGRVVAACVRGRLSGRGQLRG